MSGTKKRVIRPNLGSALRPKTSAPRKHFLTVDLTKEEHQQILQHCLAHGISLSQFFADLVLVDATEPNAERRQKMRVKFEFELTADEYDKLEMLARVHGKSDLNELVHDLLMPAIELERLHSPMDPITVRYYLSNTPPCWPAKRFCKTRSENDWLKLAKVQGNSARRLQFCGASSIVTMR